MPIKSGKTKQQIARGKRIRGYGITEIEYEVLEAQQNYLCAICGKDNDGKPLHIDHDHQTNLVRGLLCLKCNRGIGLLGDSPDNCQKAYVYLTNGTPWWLKSNTKIMQYGHWKRIFENKFICG